MGDFTVDRILLFAIFFVPGFIYLKTYRLLFAETRTDFSKDLYEAIGVSFLNAIIFLYPLILIHYHQVIEKQPLLYYLIILSIFIIAPLGWALLFYKISKKKWFSKILINPTKSAWDSFFSNRQSYYVIITLKDGRKIGGKYGLDSFSSVYPHPKEIYIEEIWKLNESEDGFIEKVYQSEGVLITENEISTIEFFL